MRNKNFLLIAGGVILLLLLVLVVVMVLAGSKQEEGVLEDQFPTAGTVTGDEQELSEEMPEDRMYWNGGEGDDMSTPPVLRTLFSGPVAGAVPLAADEGVYGSERVRFVERSSGHIYDVELSRVENPVVRSGETMLRIGRIFWSPNGSSTLIQRLDVTGENIYSYLGYFSEEQSSDGMQNTLTYSGRHLEYGDVVTAALSPDAKSILYVAKTAEGTVGYVEDVQTGTRRAVWSSPLTNITALWSNPDTVVLYTNPSSVVPGVVWLVDVERGTEQVLLTKEHALAARLNPSGTKLLYSFHEKDTGVPSLRVLDIESQSVVALPSETVSIAEKCVWDSLRDTVIYCAVPRNLYVMDYLESWQYGLLASDDVVWQIHTDTGMVKQVLDPVEVTTDPFDIVDLQVSALGDYLVFRTRQDDLLWAARVPDALLPPPDTESASSTSSL